MTQTDDLRAAFQDPPHPTRREKRAKRAERAMIRAYSLPRILSRLMLIPIAAVGLTITIFIRTSEFGPEDGLKHLLSMTGCPVTEAMGLAPAFAGEPGYHKRNDWDGDGVACGTAPAASGGARRVAAPEPGALDPRMGGGAKFVTP
ncbi:MAG: excalibur calcium-binding domain-containing protein [Rhodobacter sp.]|nr:excalibur calcium-binding domain-containing protein [Rhodobacter sp.]